MLLHGGYSSTVRTSVCGTDDEGSIPSSHPNGILNKTLSIIA